jgi:hypothetical protein
VRKYRSKETDVDEFVSTFYLLATCETKSSAHGHCLGRS